MTPKQRMLAAMARADVDYVPCSVTFRSSPEVDGYRWRTEAERLAVLTEQLGIDVVLQAGVDARCESAVRERVWEERPAGARYPLLHKEVETPQGPLRATVRRTDDWPHGDDIPFFSDFNVSRYVKPWLQTLADVEAWACVYQPPEGEEIERARRRWQALQPLRERYQLPAATTYSMGLTGAIHLFGAESGVLVAVDQPAVFDRYLEVVHRTDQRRLEVALALGVDVARRNGYYESTDFWNPGQFRRWVAPALATEAAIVHAAGRRLTYTLCTGTMPLLDDLVRLDIDCIDTIEPVLAGQDLHRLAQALRPGKCLWGGISGPIHLALGTPEAVRAAVRAAFDAFGRRGTILGTAGAIRAHWPWENVLALFDEWRRWR